MRIWRHRSFWKNTSARVPFAIFGIFLLLGSSFTTVFLYEQGVEQRDSQTIHYSYDSVKQLVSKAESDISSLLNQISLTEMHTIGLQPVVVSNDPVFSADEVNKLRLKHALVDELKLYLLSNFQGNHFQNGRYAVNVVFSDSLDAVRIEQVSMDIHRPMNLPLISPPQTKTFPTYWILHIPLCFEVVCLESMTTLSTSTRTISSVITSRYPLLYHLLDEYNQSINGVGPLWSITTILSNMYSLARGYKHYQSGKPINVVDNHHLDPLVNAGLLLQSGFVFGSVDPFALIALGASIKKAVYQDTPSSSMDSFNNMTDSSFHIPLDDFSTICTNVEVGDPLDAKIDQNPHMNLSPIAAQPLYTVQTASLCFKRGTEDLTVEVSLQDTENQIQEIIKNYTALGYTFCGIDEGMKETNMSTDAYMKNILSDVYSTTMYIEVKRDDHPLIKRGDHDGFPIDNGSGEWSILQTECTAELQKPDKGQILPGSILFGQLYDVTWSRKHYWSSKTTEYIKNETVTVWKHYTAYDTKFEENVTLFILLDEYSSCQGFVNDVSDIFYYNISVNDPNLVDTLTTYKQTIYDPAVDILLLSDSGIYYKQRVNGSIPKWVAQHAWDALYEIYDEISLIQQDTSINSSTYPDPSVLLQKTSENLLKKFEENMTTYLQLDSYFSDSMFFSCGLKAEYCVRIWYVNHLYKKIQTVFSTICDAVNSTLLDAIQDHSDIQPDMLHETMNADAGSLFDSFISIPLGIDLVLSSEPISGMQGWNESIRVAVQQFPSYLSPFEKEEFEGKKEYFLGIQNICLLGPTGIPLLPLTPATPWIVTLNLWMISVKGSYATFQISDCMDETIFHPLFGHQPQSVLRKDQLIYDKQGLLLGKNTRISFSFDTFATSIVPAYGLMVGDTDGNLIEKNGRTYE